MRLQRQRDAIVHGAGLGVLAGDRGGPGHRFGGPSQASQRAGHGDALLEPAVVERERPQRRRRRHPESRQRDRRIDPAARAQRGDRRRDAAGAGDRQRHEDRQPVAAGDEEDRDADRVERHQRAPGQIARRARCRPRGPCGQAGDAERDEAPGADRQPAQHGLLVALVVGVAVVERQLGAVGDEPQLAGEQRGGVARVLADPRRAQAGEIARHLGVGERPAGRRLGDHAGIVRLPGDRRRDPRWRLIGAVGAGAVADEEVQAAVRGDQRQPAGHRQVAQRGRRQADRQRPGERRRGEHRRALPPSQQPRQQPGADRRRDDQRVRAVQREQRRQQAGAGPRGPAIALDGAAVDQRQRGDQHGIERRLQQHDLVKRDDAGAGQQRARDQRRPGRRTSRAHCASRRRWPPRRAPPAPPAPPPASRRRGRGRWRARRRRAARSGRRRPRTPRRASSRRPRHATPARRTTRCRGRRPAGAADGRPIARWRGPSRPPPRPGSPLPPPASPIASASRRILVLRNGGPRHISRAPLPAVPMSTPNRRALLAYLIVCIAWGSTYLAIRVAVRSLPPFAMAGTRFLIAGALLAAYVYWRRLPLAGRSSRRRLRRRPAACCSSCSATAWSSGRCSSCPRARRASSSSPSGSGPPSSTRSSPAAPAGSRCGSASAW